MDLSVDFYSDYKVRTDMLTDMGKHIVLDYKIYSNGCMFVLGSCDLKDRRISL